MAYIQVHSGLNVHMSDATQIRETRVGRRWSWRALLGETKTLLWALEM